MKYRPLGARLLVQPIVTTLSLEERARAAGLEIVVEEDNRPSPTMGHVIAVGSDPLLREEISVGEIVFFNRFAGHEVVLQGQTYRQLEHNEVTGVLLPEQEPLFRPDTPPTNRAPVEVEPDPLKSNNERSSLLPQKSDAHAYPEGDDVSQHTNTNPNKERSVL